MTKRKLALAVALAALGTSTVWMSGVSAAEKTDAHGGGTGSVDTYELDPVDVTGQRAPEPVDTTLPGGFVEERPTVGMLGSQDVMDAPFTVSSMSQKAIRTFSSPADGVNGVLTLDPSVRVWSSHLYQDIAIRGFRTNGHTQYINGIPGMLGQYNIPYYWVDSVSVISGPNLGVSGTSLSEAIGGTVNYISKKAERKATEARISYLGGHSVEEAVDVSTRFGKADRWGVRITATNVGGETAIKHERLVRQNIFVNLDQHTEKSRTNLLLGYNHTKHNAGPSTINFDFSTLTKLPSAPDLSRSYKPSWSYNEYDNLLAVLNHEQKLSAHLTAFLNMGVHRENWYGYVDGTPKVFNEAGDFTISMSNWPLAFTRFYTGIGLRGDFRTGAVHHDYLVGLDRNRLHYDGDGKNFWSGTGNIYRDNDWANPGDPHASAPHDTNTLMLGWHVVDTMKAFDDRLQFTMGIHGHSVKDTPANKESKKTHAISPTFAVSWKFTPDVMVYLDHTESFGLGSTVSTTDGYKNGGERLDPAKTKQNEIGVKVKAGSFLHTLSLYQIRQANAVDVYRGTDKYRQLDGQQENRGVEWGFTGNIANRWDIIGGLSYMKVTQRKTSRGLNDGKPVDGMPHWSGSMGIVYHPTEAWSVIGRANYVGSTTINNDKTGVPSHFIFDLGANYRTKIDRTPVTISAMLYNVAGKDYWVARGASSTLGLGSPRTFTLSANFEL